VQMSLRSRGEICPPSRKRFPIDWSYLIKKESLEFKEVKHVGIEKKPVNLFGVCPMDCLPAALARRSFYY
jgi:hypothetical protein